MTEQTPTRDQLAREAESMVERLREVEGLWESGEVDTADNGPANVGGSSDDPRPQVISGPYRIYDAFDRDIPAARSLIERLATENRDLSEARKAAGDYVRAIEIFGVLNCDPPEAWPMIDGARERLSAIFNPEPSDTGRPK